jgi:hypothetical protein
MVVKCRHENRCGFIVLQLVENLKEKKYNPNKCNYCNGGDLDKTDNHQEKHYNQHAIDQEHSYQTKLHEHEAELEE